MGNNIILPIRLLARDGLILYHLVMKKLLYLIVILGMSIGCAFAENNFEHPIDAQESACKTTAQNLDEWTRCTMKAANSWNREVDKYYSLLYKKLKGDAKTALYDDQKYWNMYKNNEYKVIDALADKDNDTKERVLFRASQKRELIKTRAHALKMYYAQTFPDDEHEKIEINNTKSGFQFDPMLQRSLRWLGF